MIREYLTGERQKYLKPIKMLMVLVAVYIIIANFITPGGEVEINARNELSKLYFLGSSLTYIIQFLMNKVYGSLFMALLFTIPFTWLFRKCKITFKEKNASGEPVESALNLAEHFYTNVYVSCQFIIICYIEIPFKLFFGYEFGTNVATLIIIFFYTLCYKQLLGISWVKSLWKVILSLILVMILILTALAVIFLVIGIFDPSIFTPLHK